MHVTKPVLYSLTKKILLVEATKSSNMRHNKFKFIEQNIIKFLEDTHKKIISYL